jgi:hypothetical protein
MALWTEATASLVCVLFSQWLLLGRVGKSVGTKKQTARIIEGDTFINVLL